MNKIFLKLAGLFFILGIVDVSIILYWWFRCEQTHSSFYCDSFAFGGIIFFLGIPALILLVSFIVLLALSKWYKGNVSRFAKILISILGIVIFVAPYTPLLLPSEFPKTYSGFLNQREQRRAELEKQKDAQCTEYRQWLSEYREGQPMRTPPHEDCN